MKLDTFTNLRRIYRAITFSNIPDLKPSLYRPIGNCDTIIFKKLVLKVLKGTPLANLHLLPTSISCQPPPLANLHLFSISIASQPSRPDARPGARGRCQPFLHYVGRFPIFPNPFYSATASTLVTNRT